MHFSICSFLQYKIGFARISFLLGAIHSYFDKRMPSVKFLECNSQSYLIYSTIQKSILNLASKEIVNEINFLFSNSDKRLSDKLMENFSVVNFVLH